MLCDVSGIFPGDLHRKTLTKFCLWFYKMSWIKQPKKAALKRSVAHESVNEREPPGVKAARLSVGLPVGSGGGKLASSESSSAFSNRQACVSSDISFLESEPCLTASELRTEAGEVLVRHRPDGPWFPKSGGMIRGSSALALEIAKSPRRRSLAVQQFESLTYAPNSVGSKESLFAIWEALCKQMSFPVLPVSVHSLTEVAAVMRAAGYRSVKSYMFEVRSRHVRAGFAWTGQLDYALGDIKRAATRALGPKLKAEEIRLQWWTALNEALSWDPFPADSHPNSPMGGIYIWTFATLFLLREIELSALTIDSDCIQLDDVKKVVKIHLTVQKNDAAAKGAWRALACSCHKSKNIVCPFHVAAFLVELQRRRLGLSLHCDPIGAGLPLIGQRQMPGKVVDKDAFIVELQRFGNILKDTVAEASNIKIDRLTGHSFRRSGVKHLARLGVPYSTIQWMARHSSDVTMQYVEEAWSEAPRESLRLHDVQNLSEMLVTTLTRVESVEKALETAVTNLEESSSITGVVLDKDLLRKEVRKAMIPIKVFNLSSLKLHDVSATSCLSSDPKMWVTKCGWRWAVAVGACKAYFEMHEVPPDLEACERCQECR